jgi:hypothetical protein
MKKSNKGVERRAASKRVRALRAGLLACALLAACVATAVAKYGSPNVESAGESRVAAPAPDKSAGDYVTVEVGGKKIRVNAKTLQQGPLTQGQSQQIADALEGNKSTDGLVEVRHEDGTVSMDLQGRFQNVMIARTNDDGSVTNACVDTPEAARSFLRRADEASAVPAANGGTGATRKAAEKR